MADAMVTARMSQEKKQEGGLVLEELGISASQAINQLYDYLIKNRSLPFAGRKKLRSANEISPEEWKMAFEWVNSISVPFEEGSEFANMTIKEARMHRLRAKGEFDGLEGWNEVAS